MKPTIIFFGTQIDSAGPYIEVTHRRRPVGSVGNSDSCRSEWGVWKGKDRNSDDF